MGRISRALTLTLTVYSAVFCLDQAQADDIEFSQLGLGLLAEPDYEADQADLWPATYCEISTTCCDHEGCCDFGCDQCTVDDCGSYVDCAGVCSERCCCKRVIGWSAFLAGDGWKTKSDDDLSQTNNFGNRVGVLSNIQLGPRLWCANAYLGTSIGVYDYHGRQNSGHGIPHKAETQIFVHAGLSKQAEYELGERTSWGIAWDYMSDDHFGEMEAGINHVDLHQLRLVLGRAINSRDEIGVWGVVKLNDDIYHAANNPIPPANAAGIVPVSALPQANLYWLREWRRDAETLFSIGWAEEPADVVLGFRGQVPLGSHSALFAGWNYYVPSTSSGDFSNNNVASSFTEEYWNISAGITFYTRGFRLPSLTMSMPDNGNFAVKAPVGDH